MRLYQGDEEEEEEEEKQRQQKERRKRPANVLTRFNLIFKNIISFSFSLQGKPREKNKNEIKIAKPAQNVTYTREIY